jgi:hypothetical protein
VNVRRVAPIAAGLAIFALALNELRQTLATYDFRQVRANLGQVPASDILEAAGFTI